MSTISQQAFGVLYDYATRTVVAENDKIRSENASLKPARNLLQSIQIFRGASLITEVHVLDDDKEAEDDGFFYFAIESVVFSRQDLDQNLFQTKLAGISCVMREGHGVTAGNGVFLRAPHHYGMEFTVTAQEVSFIATAVRNDNNADNADATGRYDFSIETVKVAKSWVQRLRDLGGEVEGETSGAGVAQLLSKACSNPSRAELRLALEQNQTLQRANAQLSSSRDFLQTLDLFYPDGDALLTSLQLSSGFCQANPFDGTISWAIPPPFEYNTLFVPISSMAHLTIKSSDLTFHSNSTDIYDVTLRRTANDEYVLMAVIYSREILAFFLTVEGDDDDIDVPAGSSRVEFVHDSFMASITNAPAPYVQQEDGLHPTMRLGNIHINLEAIKDRLDVLGINFDGVDDGGEVEE